MSDGREDHSVLMVVGHANLPVARAWSVALAKHGIRVVGVVVERRGFGVRRRLLEQRARKYGPMRVLGQIAYRAVRRTARANAAPQHPDVPSPWYGWEDEIAAFTGFGNAQLLEVESLNDPAVEAMLANARVTSPSMAIVYGTSVVPTSLLALLPSVTLNLHTGLTQHYRGVNSSFWALADGEPGRIGVTIHRVDTGIDTGRVVAQRVLGPDIAYRWRSMAWLDRAVALEGERLMVESVMGILNGRIDPNGTAMPRGKFTTDPTLCEYWAVLRRFKLR